MVITISSLTETLKLGGCVSFYSGVLGYGVGNYSTHIPYDENTGGEKGLMGEQSADLGTRPSSWSIQPQAPVEAVSGTGAGV